MNKKVRQAAILELIRKTKIAGQDEILQKLETKGFVLTQATLSRDLKELKAGRIFDPEKGNIYTIPEDAISVRPITSSETQNILSIAFSNNLCVMRTSPGYATGVALRIDNLKLNEIIGTIAGDDTILIIPKDKVNKKQVMKSLLQKIPQLKELFN